MSDLSLTTVYLGWSNAVDQQAFDRVHRLGQAKEVFIHRLYIKSSVEERVRVIQDNKQALSDGALGEGSGQRVRLSVGELASCECPSIVIIRFLNNAPQCLVLIFEINDGSQVCFLPTLLTIPYVSIISFMLLDAVTVSTISVHGQIIAK